MSRIDWHGDDVIRWSAQRLAHRFEIAADLIVNETRNIMQSTGGVPSAPNTPPAVQTGFLKRSIMRERATIDRNWVKIRIGVHRKVVYAAALQFGFPKRNLQPRPYLDVALTRAMPKVRQIIGGR